jgi:recombination protein RecT
MKVNGTDAVEKTTEKTPAETMRGLILRMSDQIKTALPQKVTPDRMCRIAMTAITKNPKLAECTPASFMGALLTSAQLGLECNTPLGQAYLIPFNNKGVLETEFQLGYQGTIDLCYRTKMYRTIQARIVYEGDDFDYSYGMDEKLIHRPREKTTNPIYVYAYYELANGAKSFEVMSWSAVMGYAKKYSMAVQKGWTSPWQTNPEEMAKKTLLKKVLKYAPKAVEVAEAISQDSAIIKPGNIINDGGNVFIPKDVTDVALLGDPEQIETPKAETKTEVLTTEAAKNASAAKNEVNARTMPKQEDDAGIDAAFEAQCGQYESTPFELF